jgi:hypothetical protein
MLRNRATLLVVIAVVALATAAGAVVYAAVANGGDTRTVVERQTTIANASARTNGLSVHQIYERTYKGVVEITGSETTTTNTPFGAQNQKETVEGSGFVYDASDHVVTNGDADLTRCGENLDAEAHALRSWYVTLGDALVHDRTVPPSHIRDGDARRRLLDCVHEAVAGGDKRNIRPALVLLGASQHLDNLWRLESHLGRHAVSDDEFLPRRQSPLQRMLPRREVTFDDQSSRRDHDVGRRIHHGTGGWPGQRARRRWRAAALLGVRRPVDVRR